MCQLRPRASLCESVLKAATICSYSQEWKERKDLSIYGAKGGVWTHILAESFCCFLAFKHDSMLFSEAKETQILGRDKR